MNAGKCYEDDAGYSCTCPLAFYGERCEGIYPYWISSVDRGLLITPSPLNSSDLSAQTAPLNPRSNVLNTSYKNRYFTDLIMYKKCFIIKIVECKEFSMSHFSIPLPQG